MSAMVRPELAAMAQAPRNSGLSLRISRMWAIREAEASKTSALSPRKAR
jgi:hypothetical protein